MWAKRVAAAVVGGLLALPVWATPADDLIAGLRKECRGCDLTGVSFKKANLEGVDLTGAILTSPYRRGWIPIRANLWDATGCSTVTPTGILNGLGCTN